MTKQEFLNTPAKTPVDEATQIVLANSSMTSLKELKRQVSALSKMLYKEHLKALPLKDITAVIEKAAFLITE